MKTALRIATLLLFSVQTLAFGGTHFVCRYTGQVMDSDCCPPAVEATSSVPKVATGCCCDIQTTERAIITAVVDENGKIQGSRSWCPVTSATVTALTATSTTPQPARDLDPPDGARRYLKVRQLLL